MCGDEACVEFEFEVPADEIVVTDGDDPSVALTVTRTDEDHHPDDRGIFAFDGTWSWNQVKLESDDLIRVVMTRPDGGNIAGTLRDLDPEETAGTCGCGSVEMDYRPSLIPRSSTTGSRVTWLATSTTGARTEGRPGPGRTLRTEPSIYPLELRPIWCIVGP